MSVFETLGLGPKQADDNVVNYAIYPDRAATGEMPDCTRYWFQPDDRAEHSTSATNIFTLCDWRR